MRPHFASKKPPKSLILLPKRLQREICRRKKSGIMERFESSKSIQKADVKSVPDDFSHFAFYQTVLLRQG